MKWKLSLSSGFITTLSSIIPWLIVLHKDICIIYGDLIFDVMESDSVQTLMHHPSHLVFCVMGIGGSGVWED